MEKKKSELSRCVSKRDYFAGLALQALITIYPSRKEKDAATVAFQYADAMCVESSKELINTPPNLKG